MVALLAPEFVFTAWSQRRQACSYASETQWVRRVWIVDRHFFWVSLLRARMFEQERAQCHEKRQRIQRLDQERPKSQHKQQDVLEPEPQE